MMNLLSVLTLTPFVLSLEQVVMLGDTQSGKTSLVLRFVEGSYRDNRQPTVGAFFITKRIQVQGITCKCQIWDTAGAPEFRPLAKMYYSHAAAAILCFDLSSRQSWSVVKFWLEELHRNVPAGNIVLCLCACKVDPDALPVISSVEAQELAQSNGAMFVETSAKANHNVSVVFHKVAGRVLQFQRKNRETGIGNIPVTPGAATDGQGNVIRNVNRYGLVMEESVMNHSASNLLTTAPSQEEKKDDSHVRDDASSTRSKRRRDKRTRSRSVDEEMLPEPGMCGILPNKGDSCTVM
jgi:small GTP-binding protein